MYTKNKVGYELVKEVMKLLDLATGSYAFIQKDVDELFNRGIKMGYTVMHLRCPSNFEFIHNFAYLVGSLYGTEYRRFSIILRLGEEKIVIENKKLLLDEVYPKILKYIKDLVENDRHLDIDIASVGFKSSYVTSDDVAKVNLHFDYMLEVFDLFKSYKGILEYLGVEKYDITFWLRVCVAFTKFDLRLKSLNGSKGYVTRDIAKIPLATNILSMLYGFEGIYDAHKKYLASGYVIGLRELGHVTEVVVIPSMPVERVLGVLIEKLMKKTLEGISVFVTDIREVGAGESNE